jgi:hypothetical protein
VTLQPAGHHGDEHVQDQASITASAISS